MHRFDQRDHPQQRYEHWDGAFDNCSSLTSIVVDASNTVYSSLYGVLYDETKTMLIPYPGGKSGGFTIPNSVTSIGDYAFSGCTRFDQRDHPQQRYEHWELCVLLLHRFDQRDHPQQRYEHWG